MVFPPRHSAAGTQRLKLRPRAAQRWPHESNSRLRRRAARPGNERKTTVRCPATEPHQQRLKNIIGMVREEHHRCIRVDRTSLERSQPKPPRGRGNATAFAGRMHMDNLQRNAKLRAHLRTVICIGVRFRCAKMVMHMRRTHESRRVSSATPCPCAEQEGGRVNPPAERNQDSVICTNTAALDERCPRPHACTRAPHEAPQSAIGGVHEVMLRRFAAASANDELVRHAAHHVLRVLRMSFRTLRHSRQQ